MILVKVVPDRTMIVDGFERFTMQCLDCGDVEDRFTFRSATVPEADTAANATAPATEAMQRKHAPVGEASASTSTAWLRAIERVRGWQAAEDERRSAGPSGKPATARLPRQHIRHVIAPASKIEITAPRAEGAAMPNGNSKWARAVAKLRERQERR